MDFTGYPGVVEQALVILMAMEALTTAMAILFCLALAAFAVYLAGVFHLCRAEIRSGGSE